MKIENGCKKERMRRQEGRRRRKLDVYNRVQKKENKKMLKKEE